MLNGLALFAGIGGLELGLSEHVRTVCYVEQDDYAAKVLQARIKDGQLDDAPIWDDIRTFDGKPWRGVVDIVVGGFPCQDVSVAGRRAGIEGARSGLWAEMFRVVCEVRPQFVFVENVPGLLSRGLGRVLGDLASVGYDAEWLCLQAAEVGAPHRRERVFVLAHTLCADSGGRPPTGDIGDKGRQASPTGRESIQSQDRKACSDYTKQGNEDVAHTESQQDRRLQSPRLQPDTRAGSKDVAYATYGHVSSWRNKHTSIIEAYREGKTIRLGRSSAITEAGMWAVEPDMGRVAHGVPSRVDRLKCLGNAVVPLQAKTAFEMLWQRMNLLAE
ncbi:hypothetical protein LCGC14_1450280 [marine sediment metagenome]|uniref:DNA (cytosine-5-)-methyltransferase n=1 Tax=marine sediment metagenome TaxID=412755 RepID=A0A0F9LYP4_9ZZZZ